MNDNILREELLALLDGMGAHMPFHEAVANFPDEAINRRPPNVSYTPWQLLEGDLATLRALAADPATDLFATIPNSPGHTLLRELRVVADHNAYHIGEFAIFRQVMEMWRDDRASVVMESTKI